MIELYRRLITTHRLQTSLLEKLKPLAPLSLAVQKLVNRLPSSVSFVYILGCPDSSLKAEAGTKGFVMYALPLILRQSEQWQRALNCRVPS